MLYIYTIGLLVSHSCVKGNHLLKTVIELFISSIFQRHTVYIVKEVNDHVRILWLPEPQKEKI